MALTQLVTDPNSFMERKITGRGLRWEVLLLLVITLGVFPDVFMEMIEQAIDPVANVGGGAP